MCPVTPHTWPRGQCKVSWSLRTSGRGPGEPGTDAGQLRFIETHLDSWGHRAHQALHTGPQSESSYIKYFGYVLVFSRPGEDRDGCCTSFKSL